MTIHQLSFPRNLVYHEITFQLFSSHKRKRTPCDFYDLTRETTILCVNHHNQDETMISKQPNNPIRGLFKLLSNLTKAVSKLHGTFANSNFFKGFIG